MQDNLTNESHNLNPSSTGSSLSPNNSSSQTINQSPQPANSPQSKPNENKEGNAEFEQVLKEIRQELIIEGYSSKTLKMYLLYEREALYFVNKKLDDVNSKDLISYLAHKKENDCSNATLALIHASLQYLFEKHLKKHLMDDLKIPKKAKSLPKVLTKDEIRALFSATKFGRNRLMLQFMYGSGCRVSEVVKLKVEDLNLKERTAAIRGGKGNKDRMIILSKEWISDIKRYLDKKKVKSEFVFSKKNGKTITTDSIQRIVRKAAKKAGINKHVTPHCLRHSYATHLLEAGTNIRYIQSLLGHSNLNTTQIYTSVANDQLKKVVSPLDKL